MSESNMKREQYREIPYNYTSADDRLIIRHLFGPAVWDNLEELRSQRITGRSARLMMRFMGDLFILGRNPFLYQELIDSAPRRRHFIRTAEKDLAVIETAAKIAGKSDERKEKVFRLVAMCRDRLKALSTSIKEARATRAKIAKRLSAVIGRENVGFDPFTLISHATDATDWRLYLPLAVLRPTEEAQVPELLSAIAELGLYVIPRGGGTGLTGGSVPVRPDCVVINTEKLNRIHPVTMRTIGSPQEGVREIPVMRADAGVITQDAMAAAKASGLVFATDPTSAWAATIGGNIAENAGGKTAVLWGTAIDNLLTYRIAMPGGRLYTVRRTDHPLRKILPEDLVVFEILDESDAPVREVRLRGDEIRKKGLWKDITNKALGGLPGVQKEGCDGVITSAEFILHTAYPEKTTFCLEFFGQDMDEASRVIVRISDEFKNNGEEALMALEHFDEEYIKAIDYKFKAARSERPKAVLLVDMVAHTPEQIERGITRLQRLLTPFPNTEVFTAKDEEEAERFWRDRKRLGAIAARTNAFKLNEDIVLPLPALAEFARFVDAYNIEEDLHNKEVFIHETLSYLKEAEPVEDPDWLEAKIPMAEELCDAALEKLAQRTEESIRHDAYIHQLMKDLLELFRGYHRVSANIEAIYEKVRARRIIIATHMHAGDGNVHVNIPVFSNDLTMMNRAEKAAEHVMAKAVALDGVVSGEHGIGITKMKFLEPEKIRALSAYRSAVDPSGIMNPGKLSDPQVMEKVFTPSFNLLGLEARILQHGSLADLSNKIARCIRCGKCKADCCVFYPKKNVFFHPRNKNLAIGALIEALLYDIQRSHFPRFTHLKNLTQIADHCTMCHKCFAPCPVKIDTAEVSVLERELLESRHYKHTALPTKLSLLYLASRNRYVNALFRKTVLQWGGGLQRLAAGTLKLLPASVREKAPPSVDLLKSPMAPASPSTLRKILPACAAGEALMISPATEIKKTVFYFPGCGSERLHADVSMAALHILLAAGVRVVLPPPFLCCGFPAKVNAKKEMHDNVALRDTIIFSQIREMLGHIEFDSCVVSCGTCKDALTQMGAGEIFGCQVTDVGRFALETADSSAPIARQGKLLYHAPCHDTLGGAGEKFLTKIAETVTKVPGCCSEAGTMALSRPDITGAMLHRKRAATRAAMEQTNATVMVTNCPSCLSGLGRQKDQGLTPRHITVELARRISGEKWRDELPAMLAKTETVTF